MKLMDTVGIALKAIRANTLRSILTTLGIIIGVGSVIVMVAVGSGASKAVEDQIASLGTNLLTLVPGSSRFGGRRGGAGTALPFTDSDIEAIASIPGVTAVSGRVATGATIVFGGVNWTTRIEGVNASYPIVRDWPAVEGRFLEPSEVRSGARVAVVGRTIVEEVFGGGSPLGAQIRIANVPFEVIGVMRERGESTFGQDQDDIILVPLTVARARLEAQASPVPNRVEVIYLKVASADLIDAVTEDLTELMRERRKIRPGADDDFGVRNFAEFIRARTETQRTLGWLLGTAAAISLVVGGIGIMNIMLVSVTERTREIGLRMAVGARRQAILLQFLVEAVTLCMIGGLIGITLGISGTFIVANIAGWPVFLSPMTIALALAASAGVGIIFGYFPARRAARLDPIEALRYE